MNSHFSKCIKYDWVGSTSNALDRSKKILVVSVPWSKYWCQSLVAVTRASWVELKGLKPNWDGDKRSFSRRCLRSLLCTILSKSLDGTESREMGL